MLNVSPGLTGLLKRTFRTPFIAIRPPFSEPVAEGFGHHGQYGNARKDRSSMDFATTVEVAIAGTACNEDSFRLCHSLPPVQSLMKNSPCYEKAS